MDFDFKHYLKEIFFCAILFGLMFAFSRSYKTGEFNEEFTKEEFRTTVLYMYTGIITFVTSLLSVIFSVKIDFRKKEIDYTKSLVKNSVLFFIHILFVIILFLMIDLNIYNMLNCALRFLILTTTGYLTLEILTKYTIKNR